MTARWPPQQIPPLNFIGPYTPCGRFTTRIPHRGSVIFKWISLLDNAFWNSPPHTTTCKLVQSITDDDMYISCGSIQCILSSISCHGLTRVIKYMKYIILIHFHILFSYESCWAIMAHQDYYDLQYVTLVLHSYCTCTYTEVTELLFWSTVTI